MSLTAISRSDAAALIPDDLARQVIAGLPSASVLLGNPLVTHRTMSRATQRLPILSMLPVAYWVNPADSALIEQTRQEWANKSITAEKLAVIVPVPRDVAGDVGSFDFWEGVVPHLVGSIGAGIDGAILFGTNAPASFPEDLSTGCDRTDHEIRLGVGVDWADDTNRAMQLVEVDGFDVNGHLGPISLKARFRGLRATTGELILQNAAMASVERGSAAASLWNAPVTYSRNGSWNPALAEIITGRWLEVFIGVREDLAWQLVDEATVGGVNLAETDQIGLKVTYRMGWQIGNPPTRENPDDATRYPFAAVRPLDWIGAGGVVS